MERSDAFDALVIGGGLVGCASAYHLAGAGASVLLIEADRVNAGASSRNAGSLHFQLERRLLEQGDAAAAQCARIVPLSVLAIESWREVERALGVDLEVVMHGGLMVAETDAELRVLEQKFALEQKWGLPTELLDGAAARRMAPYLSENVRGAGYCPHEGHANPRLVAPAFAEAAAKRGATIWTRSTLTSLTRDSGGYLASVSCEGRGEIAVRAETVLNAAGAAARAVGEMSGLHLPVYPVGLTMHVTERRPPLIEHMIQHAGRRLSMKQVRDGNILIGGGWPSRLARTARGFDPGRTPAYVIGSTLGNLRAAADVVPAAADVSLLRTWTGVATLTPDQLPLLGMVSASPGYFVATSGSGFTLGLVYARQIADLMLTGESSADVSLYAPDRFKHLNAFVA